nr:hypothetical protein [Tanacetum cinerariifolium]
MELMEPDFELIAWKWVEMGTFSFDFLDQILDAIDDWIERIEDRGDMEKLGDELARLKLGLKCCLVPMVLWLNLVPKEVMWPLGSQVESLRFKMGKNKEMGHGLENSPVLGFLDNNNGWLEEDPEEEPEEDDEDMVNNEEDDAEVINPYEDADPHNRPSPTSDKETEFAPPMVQIADAYDVPIPHVIQFGSNFHVGESSATTDLLVGNSEVYVPGLMCCDLKSVHRGVKRLSKHMHDRYRMEKKMANKLRQDEFRMNDQEFDITTFDSAEEPSIYTALVPRADDPYVMVRDAAMDTRGDEDVDTDAPWDTQPFEPRGSPHDSH